MKGFTLIELVIVITMLSILGSYGFIKYSDNQAMSFLEEYKFQVINRVDELYKKSLIGINWHYNNNGVTDVDYIKIYCDDLDKSFEAYICDNTNSKSPEFNNCKKIDFPTLSNIEYGTFLSKYTKNNIKINNCIYINNNSNIYNNGSFYLIIKTNFPNGKLQMFKENNLNTIDNELDDIEVNNVKINVKHESNVVEFFPLNFK